jgi:hypothetical protein
MIEIKPVYIFPFYFSKIHLIYFCHLCLILPQCLLPCDLLTVILYAFSVVPVHTTFPVYLIPHFTFLTYGKNINYETSDYGVSYNLLCYVLPLSSMYCNSDHLNSILQ